MTSDGFLREQVRAEVVRMRERCAALELPVVYGHGDLKPSNVMRRDATVPAHPLDHAIGNDDAISFIDFELAGAHYRGYDLYKLFRTADDFSNANVRMFLESYLAALPAAEATAAAAAAASVAPASGSERALTASLAELEAEAYAAEPLTWLEAAVFFLFALSVYPDKAETWRPLAVQRWESYLASASRIDADGEATAALLAARSARCAV